MDVLEIIIAVKHFVGGVFPSGGVGGGGE